MDIAPEFIKSFRNGAAQQDGEAVAFEIETDGGQPHALACNTGDIGKMVSWLIGLGVMADEQRATGEGGDEPQKTEINATPVPVKHVAAAPGQAPGEVVVGINLGLFDLAFTLPAEAARTLHQALGRSVAG